METRIVEKDSFKVIGMSLETLLQDEREQRNIPKLFDAFAKRMTEVGNRNNDRSIGIFIDPPNYNPKTDKFKWIAGVEVSDDKDVPEGMEFYSFPKHTYACTTYRGSMDVAHQAYNYLYQWVKESEYTLADSFGIEYVLESNGDGSVVMDLMFPVKK
jgi:predicted transcriptional regulator YdeE